MKKNIHIFSLVILLLAYLIVPVTAVAQTPVMNLRSAQTTASTNETISEEEGGTQSTSEETSENLTLKSIDQKPSDLTTSTEIQPRAPSVRVAGEDPGVTITSPDSISSSQLVELDVTLAGSAGMLSEDGDIQVTIPKEAVRNSGDLVNRLVIGDPFYLADPAVSTDSNGNYILNVKYDHTKIDQSSAFGATFKILFQAPLYSDTDPDVPDTIDFTTNLSQNGVVISEDSSSSQIVPGHSSLSQLSKWSPQPSKIVQGVNAAIMDDSIASRNIFAISVNYNQGTIKDARVIDTVPDGTELADPNKYIPATGDATVYNHFRIAKVTSRNDAGTPNGWEYVTDQFADKIEITTTGFSISLGDLTPDDSYVIMYAEKIDGPITPEEFGVRYNHVDLYSGGTKLTSRDAALALNDDAYQALSLNKAVSQSTLSTNESNLEYTLKLKGLSDVIKAGTVITDPLPEKTQFIETIQKDNEFISDANYDSSTNKVIYTVLKDIPVNMAQTIKFKVKYSDSSAKPGDEITNRASINYAGSEIYSNVAVTTLEGSAYLYKTDEASDPLAGAEFKIVDSEGGTVKEGLVSDDKGFINSGLLTPGHYQFLEVKAPSGYELDSTPIDFDVVAGQEVPIELTKINKLLVPGEVTLTKIDADTNEPLQGAEFKLQDALGNDIRTNLTSDDSGKIKVRGLNSGDYQFIETKAPEGYILDETPLKFTIKNSQAEAVQLTAKNKQANRDVVLTKVDSKTGKTLEGTIFELQDQTGKTLQQELKTDKNGQIFVQGLNPGDYQFVETKAPNNYKLDSTPLEFTIKSDSVNTVQVTMTNDRITDNNEKQDSSDDITKIHKKKASHRDISSNKLLPTTGENIGLTLLSLIGVVLVAMVLIFWLHRAKSSK